jgi:hypothetical protein
MIFFFFKDNIQLHVNKILCTYLGEKISKFSFLNLYKYDYFFYNSAHISYVEI